MGGPCYRLMPVPEEQRTGQFQGPPCTDNFQISEFHFAGAHWHFESGGAYGGRVCGLGQNRDVPIRADWETEKVAEMYRMCVAKYANGGKRMAE